MESKVILDALVEIIKTGGLMALWGISIWLIIGLVKLVVFCLAVYFIIQMICNTISNNYKIHKELDSRRIHLLSSQVSQDLCNSLDSMNKEFLAILRELEKKLNELSATSKKNTT